MVLEKLTALFGVEKVDIVVNNGGMSMREEFKNLDFSVCESMINTNLLSHIAATKAALPGMIQRKSGVIVNISSAAGILATPLRTMYSASKFGLSGFGKALRSEMKQHGIQVVQIYPGYVRTNISNNAMTGTGEKFGKIDSNIANGMRVEDCCEQIMKAIVLKRTEVIIGGLQFQILPFLVPFETLVSVLMDKLYKK